MPVMPAHADRECLNATMEYLERGFSVIPVARATKRPFFSWAEYQARHPEPDELEAWWKRFPEANVAIICGKISGIYCVDGDGEEGQNWIAENLIPTTVYSKTARGIHAIYRIPAHSVIRNRVRLAPQVDIRGEGGYFVAPPSVHATGHKYQWIFMANGWEDIPEYAPPMLNLDLSRTQASPLSCLHGLNGIGERNDTLARLVGRWVGKNLDPDEILALALTWNAKNNPPLPEKEVRRTVESIIKTHEKNHAEEVKIFVPGPQESSVPKEVLSPGGLMQAMVRYIEDASPASHPAFSTLATAVTIGAVLGQKIRSESGLRTNLYGMGLGYSGAGKNAPHSTIPHLLCETSAHGIIGPNILTSDAALLKRLSKHQNQLCLLDEVASILKALRNPQSPMANIPSILMQLWTGTDRKFVKSYATGEEIVVPWHHLAIYGTTTPERFWESITPGETTDGFVARLIIFDVRDDAPLPKMTINPNVPSQLVDAVERLWSIPVKTKGGNIEAVPDPYVIPIHQDANAILKDFSNHYHHKKNRTKTAKDGRSSIYGRAAENAYKLAMIHAASLSLDNVIYTGIGRESMEWATQIIRWSTETTIKRIQTHVSENDWHRMEQSILRLIANKATDKKPGLTGREILRGVWGLSVKNRDMLLDTMIQAGKIVAQPHKPRSGKECTIYCLAELRDDDHESE